MRVLGIETATWTASVAIIDEGQTLAEHTLPQSASHGTSLFPLIGDALRSTALRLSDIELLAVSIGPGSFTGLRIGLSVVKGLALATGTPVIGVPTLEALAFAVGPQPQLLWATLDARKREVYAAAFRYSGDRVECVMPATVCTAEELARRLQPPCVVVGNGVDAYGEVLRARCGSGVELRPAAAVAPSGAAVARLGLLRFGEQGEDQMSGLEPCYVRSSEAERARFTSV